MYNSIEKLNNAQNNIYYLNNSLIDESIMSHFIFHELSKQKIIELLISFNHSIKSAKRFLTKTTKVSISYDLLHA